MDDLNNDSLYSPTSKHATEAQVVRGRRIDLKRALKARHVTMIRYVLTSPSESKEMLKFFTHSIGGWLLVFGMRVHISVTKALASGVIGTGLFLGTATALANGGPVGLLLGYVIVGSMCYGVMVIHSSIFEPFASNLTPNIRLL